MIKQTLLTGWNFIRWFRLGLGILLAIEAILNYSAFPAILGILFLYQAITNTGCCGVKGCAVQKSKAM